MYISKIFRIGDLVSQPDGKAFEANKRKTAIISDIRKESPAEFAYRVQGISAWFRNNELVAAIDPVIRSDPASTFPPGTRVVCIHDRPEYIWPHPCVVCEVLSARQSMRGPTLKVRIITPAALSCNGDLATQEHYKQTFLVLATDFAVAADLPAESGSFRTKLPEICPPVYDGKRYDGAKVMDTTRKMLGG